jgi:hypothetical protein
MASTAKPNQISSNNDMGELQATSPNWDGPGAPASPVNSPQVDPYSPASVGGVAGGSHNSEWLDSTPTD